MTRNKLEQQLEEIVLVGVTGNIGSGKSLFSNIAAERGYPVISSDDNAKQLMQSNEKLKQLLKKEFGEDIYLQNGELDKPKLAALIFGEASQNKRNLTKMNAIVHPIVIDYMTEQIEELASKGHKLIFVESALMIESGVAEGMDYIVFIQADEDIRLRRVIQRGLTPNDAKARIANQEPEDKKKAIADFVISNNTTIEEFRKASTTTLDILEFLPPKEESEE